MRDVEAHRPSELLMQHGTWTLGIISRILIGGAGIGGVLLCAAAVVSRLRENYLERLTTDKNYFDPPIQ